METGVLTKYLGTMVLPSWHIKLIITVIHWDILRDGPELKLHWSPEHRKLLLWLMNQSNFLGLLELVFVQSQGSVTPETSDSFLFPNV